MSEDTSDKKASKKKKAKKGEVEVAGRFAGLAVASVKRTRARCGLFGFAIVLALCLLGDVPPFDATFRALIAGIVCHLAGWYVSIVVWRQIIRHQAAEAAEAYTERIRKAHLEAAERATAALNAQQAAEAEAEASWAATIST